MTTISGASADASGVSVYSLTAKQQMSGDCPPAEAVAGKAVTPSAGSGDAVVNLSAEARAQLDVALAAENKGLATPSDATAESSVGASIGSVIAKGQESGNGPSTEPVTGKAATPSADSGAVVIDLLSEARAWLELNSRAVHEKALIAASRWDNAVRIDVNDNSASLYAKFGQASAAEREAYVQRRLCQFDEGQALDSVYQQYKYAVDNNIPVSTVNPADIPKERNSPSREHVEHAARIMVQSWVDGPVIYDPAHKNVSQPTPALKSAPKTEQDVVDWIHAQLVKQRQQMGADPNISYQVTYTNTGQLISNGMTASVPQELVDAQAAYDRVLAKRLDVEAAGGKWVAAIPVRSSPADSASDAPANPLRYEESHQMYLPNIADLPLAMARKSLEFAEYVLSSHTYDGIDINAGYGDQAISDMNAYVTAVKDHIGRLESGASPVTRGAK